MNDTENVLKKQPWYMIWFRVYFSPSVKTYRSILQTKETNLSRATLWVMVSTGIRVVFPLFLYWTSNQQIVHGDIRTAIRTPDEIGWIMYAISGFLAVGFASLIFPAVAYIVDWFAQRVGGIANADKLGFLMGAIWAPAGIVDTVSEGFLPPLIGQVLRFVVVLIEALLMITSLRSANELSWGRATSLVVIPCVVILATVGIIWFS